MNNDKFINRFSRQADLVPINEIEQCSATVIGVGAIGRQVAIQLASIGVPKIQLIDFDSVEDVNLAVQGFTEEDMNLPKVEAVARTLKAINSSIEVDIKNERFRRSMEIGNAMFVCVDDIEVREMIHRHTENRVSYFSDGRMSGESIRILTATSPSDHKFYKTTLFAKEEAQEGPCTAKSTIYSASGAACLMVAEFTKWLRGYPLSMDISFNLMTTELAVKDQE